MTTEIMKTRAITAAIPAILTKIVTGTVAITTGSRLFSYETMKMEINENTQVTGIFTSFLVAGATVLAGEVIGYFTSTGEE